jgi:hypothetical protein
MSSQLLDTEGAVAPSKHWLKSRWIRWALVALGALIAGTLVFEYIHWLNSGMGFVEHMSHLREHIWSLITTFNWEPEEHPAWLRVLATYWKWMW